MGGEYALAEILPKSFPPARFHCRLVKLGVRQGNSAVLLDCRQSLRTVAPRSGEHDA